MWSPNPHRKDGVLVVVATVAAMVVVMEVSPAKVTATSDDSPCVTPKDVNCDPAASKLSDKIIGGNIAEPGSTPWLVSLRDANYDYPMTFCGGTLLSHTWVLTSATCVYSYQNNYASIEVVVGEYDETYIDGYERYRWVNEITLHPDYDVDIHNADIALIRLGFYVFYSERIDVLKLPSMDQEHHSELDSGGERHSNNDLYMIAGWGRVGEGGEPSTVVRVAQIPLVNVEDCKRVYPQFTNTMLCAGNLTHGGLDSCQFDKGGALATSDGYIKGVSSWSIGCGRPGYPGVYTDVAKVTDWICSVTERGISHPYDSLSSCRDD